MANVWQEGLAWISFDNLSIPVQAPSSKIPNQTQSQEGAVRAGQSKGGRRAGAGCRPHRPAVKAASKSLMVEASPYSTKITQPLLIPLHCWSLFYCISSKIASFVFEKTTKKTPISIFIVALKSTHFQKIFEICIEVPPIDDFLHQLIGLPDELLFIPRNMFMYTSERKYV